MRVVAPADARAAPAEGGGRLSARPRAVRCCGGGRWLLEAGTSPSVLDFRAILPIVRHMRHVPTWLKLVAAVSVAAEACAAAAIFWHTGPRAR